MIQNYHNPKVTMFTYMKGGELLEQKNRKSEDTGYQKFPLTNNKKIWKIFRIPHLYEITDYSI